MNSTNEIQVLTLTELVKMLLACVAELQAHVLLLTPKPMPNAAHAVVASPPPPPIQPATCSVHGCILPSAQGGKHPDGLCEIHAEEWRHAAIDLILNIPAATNLKELKDAIAKQKDVAPTNPASRDSSRDNICTVVGCILPSAQGGNYPDGLCERHADEWCEKNRGGTASVPGGYMPTSCKHETGYSGKRCVKCGVCVEDEFPQLMSDGNGAIAGLQEITLCPRCEGSGVYNFGPCAICNGTGRLGEDGEAFTPKALDPASLEAFHEIAKKLEQGIYPKRPSAPASATVEKPQPAATKAAEEIWWKRSWDVCHQNNENLRAENAQLKARVAELEGNIEHERKAGDALQSQRDTAVKGLTDMTTARNDYLLELNSLKQLVPQLQKAANDAQEVKTRLSNTISNNINTARKDLAAKEAEHKAALEKMGKELADMTTTRNDYLSQLQLANSVRNNIDADNKRLKKERDALDNLYAQANLMIDDLRKQVYRWESSRTGKIELALRESLMMMKNSYPNSLEPAILTAEDALALPADAPSEPGAEGKLAEVRQELEALTAGGFSGWAVKLLAKFDAALASHPQPSQPEPRVQVNDTGSVWVYGRGKPEYWVDDKYKKRTEASESAMSSDIRILPLDEACAWLAAHPKPEGK